jgi:hypothetical protein
MMKDMFQNDWVPGRDAFRSIMREHKLLLPAPKPRHTTNSNHRFHKYRNLIRGFIPTAANQLWVSDITYIDLVGDCCYLHLVTDAYSRKIVGWKLADTLEADNTLEALRMAISQATADELRGLIHHSDRGVQYCCNAYTEELKKFGVRISMTEDYKPTDNAIAERVNGILKTEVIYRERRFKTIDDARERISSFISFYKHFVSDKAFQVKSLNKTVTFVGPDPDDDFSTMEGLVTADTWEAFAPQLPEKTIYNIIYGKPQQAGHEKIFILRGIANGLEMELRFKRVNNR